ncbi:MAG: hypothetical protein CVU65_13865 [Deltaproteobacteria bacterium HGW-Deltaproteobacteria-22]|nr:MAG: hypothetical protein CVU65_13865 [Deltaproteobacteria bacterium HGW-Deltaproteobacteria-22]
MMRKTVLTLTLATCLWAWGCDADTKNVDSCGDGFLDPGEECDSINLDNESCSSLGRYNALGTLGCKENCTFDLTDCGGICGDGVVDGPDGEQCDGGNLNAQTCSSLGFAGGALACGADCRFELTNCQSLCGNGLRDPTEGCDDGNAQSSDGCSNVCQVEEGFTCSENNPSICTPVCGDGLVRGTETCDGTNLDGATCVTQGFHPGELACDAECDFDFELCGGRCGDGVLQEAQGEACDGADFGEVSCENLSIGTGDLACTAGCTRDESGCVALFKAVSVSSGGEHTCAVKSDGSAWCWGRNYNGQLGDGTTTDRSVPTPVSGLSTGVTAISAGMYHTCVIKTDGSVWCWGNNGMGQLGDGTTTARLVPTAVPALSANVDLISAGSFHTCAITFDGNWSRVWCWGSNISGQLGDGTTTQRNAPVASLSAEFITGISAGYNHTCAIEGSAFFGWSFLHCWGSNDDGELGDGTNTNRTTPTQIMNGSDSPLSVSAAWGHTCALKRDGSAWCWGYNIAGQLGDGTTTGRNLPAVVSGLGSDVSILSAGGFHTCAVKTDGSAWCWGSNFDGELGDGTNTDRLIPTAVSGLGSGVSTISSGIDFYEDHGHTCVRKASGFVWCWGYNADGRLGDGTTTQRLVPAGVIPD